MSKQKKVALQIDPIEKLDFATDSTMLIASELQNRGYQLFYYLPRNLFFERGGLYAMGSYIELDYSKGTFSKSEKQKVLLEDFKVIFIRQIPPFNQEYLTTTYMLETLKRPLILNEPQAIRNVAEKLSIVNFPKFIPETMITASNQEIKRFLAQYKIAILKPLYDCGGRGVIKLSHDSNNINEYVQRLLGKYGYVMLQEYLSDVVTLGDKRVLFMDGEIIGVINRKPQPGDFRVNMLMGGRSYSTSLTKKEKDICHYVGKFLKDRNLFLVGIDLIAEKLIEINVTSPTGFVAINKLYKQNIEKIIVDQIEIKIKN